jgi:hypothetical protein
VPAVHPPARPGRAAEPGAWARGAVQPGRAPGKLRPGGVFCFVEHGLAPDARTAWLQRRLTPVQRRAFGGCHLDRRIDRLVGAAGLELARLDTYYMKGPRALGYTFEGAAVRP